jgi:hypothetical protein
MFDPLEQGYVPIDECAQRMGVTVERVRELVLRGVLRHRDGWVQPAVISGCIE